MKLGSPGYIRALEEEARFRHQCRRDRKAAAARKKADLWFRIAGDRINEHQQNTVQVRGSYQSRRAAYESKYGAGG